MSSPPKIRFQIKFLTDSITDWLHMMDTSQHVYRFHWDTDEHIMAIRNVSKLTKGCKCKRNSCKSKQCGCRHSGQTCGPGCQCINCENLLTTVTQTPASEVSEAAALYFQGNIVQSLRVGEEFEEKTKKWHQYWKQQWIRKWLKRWPLLMQV